MSTRRRIIDPSVSSAKEELTVSGDNLHYLRNVLRVKEGNDVEVLDGKGGVYMGVIKSVGKKELAIMLLRRETPDIEPSVNIHLLQPLLKGEKMDLVIQKTTELGIRGIIPVVTEHSVPRGTRKIDHWRKVAMEAVRQCGRTAVPEVEDVMGLEEAIGLLPEEAQKYVFHEKGGKNLGDAVVKKESKKSSIFLLTGPEGGLSEREVNMSVSSGFEPVNLGRRILRAETATIVAVTLLQFVLGELG
ncbi:MAG: 16S rRNA (uracil(1498)-N(3))-methyltransferase [Nitrospirae bacterium]|nr:MAG: 16S rRNA (uracil(1498)-N(3))-methyltransferase [Nitrospirota bacterium]